MARPTVTLALEDRRPHDSIRDNRDDHTLTLRINPVKPDLNFLAVEEIFFEKCSVFLSDVLEEDTHLTPILRNQAAESQNASVT